MMETGDFDGPKKALSVSKTTKVSSVLVSAVADIVVLGVLEDEQLRGKTRVVEKAGERACAGAGTAD